MSKVKIKSNERVAIVGKTGTGKTYLAQRVIWRPMEHVIFYDWKHAHYPEMDAPTLRTISDVKEALDPKNPKERTTKFVFAPKQLDIETWEKTCEICWEAGNIHLIADELKGVYSEGNHVEPITKHHEYILTRGRIRGVGITGVTQRPKRIPMETLSEAEHLFVFRLNLHDDRKRIAEVAGHKAGEMAARLNGHEFVYYNVDMNEPRLCNPI